MPPGSRYLGFGGVAERFAQMLSTRRVAVVANGGLFDSTVGWLMMNK